MQNWQHACLSSACALSAHVPKSTMYCWVLSFCDHWHAGSAISSELRIADHFQSCDAQVAEIAANPWAEVAWYFPTSREQYRISGTLQVVEEGHSDASLCKVTSTDCKTGVSSCNLSFTGPGQDMLRVLMHCAELYEAALFFCMLSKNYGTQHSKIRCMCMGGHLSSLGRSSPCTFFSMFTRRLPSASHVT